MYKKTFSILTFVLVVLAMIAAPVFAGNGPGPLETPPSGGDGKPGGDDEIFPWFPGDPAWLECERVGSEFPYSLRIGTGSAIGGMSFYAYGNAIFVDEVWSQGYTGDVHFDWSSDPDPIGIVIVKSGRAAKVYRYNPPALYDDDLTAAGPWDPSHLTFCWGPGQGGDPTPTPGPPVCEWVDETAWGAGDRYVEQGNWATYTEYVTELNIILFAGQYMEAGYLTFSEPDAGDMVTITITLFDGWQFADVEENVKIQPYDEPPPAENPSPGEFDYKATADESPFEIVVPLADFYGIHLDVQWEDCE